MTMKSSFCSELVEACEGQIVFPVYDDGDTYCEKHVGGSSDKYWSYPYEGEKEPTGPHLLMEMRWIGVAVTAFSVAFRVRGCLKHACSRAIRSRPRAVGVSARSGSRSRRWRHAQADAQQIPRPWSGADDPSAPRFDRQDRRSPQYCSERSSAMDPSPRGGMYLPTQPLLSWQQWMPSKPHHDQSNNASPGAQKRGVVWTRPVPTAFSHLQQCAITPVHAGSFPSRTLVSLVVSSCAISKLRSPSRLSCAPPIRAIPWRCSLGLARIHTARSARSRSRARRRSERAFACPSPDESFRHSGRDCRRWRSPPASASEPALLLKQAPQILPRLCRSVM